LTISSQTQRALHTLLPEGPKCVEPLQQHCALQALATALPRTGSTLLAHFSAWRAAVWEGGSAYSLNSGGGTTAPGYASGLSAMAQLPSCVMTDVEDEHETQHGLAEHTTNLEMQKTTVRNNRSQSRNVSLVLSYAKLYICTEMHACKLVKARFGRGTKGAACTIACAA